MLLRSIPAGDGQDPSIHAEISADNQVLRGLTLLVVFIRAVFCSVQAGISWCSSWWEQEEFSVSALTARAL